MSPTKDLIIVPPPQIIEKSARHNYSCLAKQLAKALVPPHSLIMHVSVFNQNRASGFLWFALGLTKNKLWFFVTKHLQAVICFKNNRSRSAKQTRIISSWHFCHWPLDRWMNNQAKLWILCCTDHRTNELQIWIKLLGVKSVNHRFSFCLFPTSSEWSIASFLITRAFIGWTVKFRHFSSQGSALASH